VRLVTTEEIRSRIEKEILWFGSIEAQITRSVGIASSGTGEEK